MRLERTTSGTSGLPRTGWYRALLTSTLFHILLVVGLALIALQNQPTLAPLSLLSHESQATALAEVPQFELAPQVTIESPIASTANDFAAIRELELPAIENLAPDVGIEPTQSNAESAPADSLLAASQALSGTIQDRVSQAGGKKGEVQFALAWHNVNDVDLHVIAPEGDRISHMRRRLPDGGMLDVDMNVKGESRQPVENVRWILNAPAGRYTVMVHLFRIHSPTRPGERPSRSSRFELLAQLGSQTTLQEDVVSRNKQLVVYRFRYVPDNIPPHRKTMLLAALDELQTKDEALARPAFDLAVAAKAQRVRDQLLNNLIVRYPHTDVAIEAMQLLGGEVTKP